MKCNVGTGVIKSVKVSKLVKKARSFFFQKKGNLVTAAQVKNKLKQASFFLTEKRR